MALNSSTLAVGGIGLSAGFVIALITAVLPAQLNSARQRELAEAGQLQASFIARQEREAAQRARAHSFEAKMAKMDQLFREARIAVEKTVSGPQVVRFDKLRIAERPNGTYVCGEVGTKRPNARDYLRRGFIYSSDGELAVDPGDLRRLPPLGIYAPDAAVKWQEYQARVAC